MARLTQRDIQALHACIHMFHTQHDLVAFPRQALRAIKAVVPAMYLSYNEANLRSPPAPPTALVPEPPAFPGIVEVFAAYIHEHPVFNHHRRSGDQRVLKISDFLSQGAFHRLGLYHEFYRRLGTEYQISFTLPAPAPYMIAIACNRETSDFSERDRRCLNLLHPHLVQAHATARALTQLTHDRDLLGEALTGLNHGVMTIDEKGEGKELTPQVWQWIRTYFDMPLWQRGLPEELRRWIGHQRRQTTRDDEAALAPRTPLIMEQAGERLVVRLVANRFGVGFLLLEEQQSTYTPETLERLGLTKRQAEVLFWVAQGKTDDEVGIILGISRRTVQKHLERVYKKLEVDNRTAAAQWAFEVLGSPPELGPDA